MSNEFIDKTSEVYKKRQAEQDLRRKYRERAIQLYTGTAISIVPTCTPVITDDGAFVDAVVFIPKSEITDFEKVKLND